MTKFDAIKNGWTLDKALLKMHITPSCENCKHIEFIRKYASINTCYCRKHKEYEPSLCENWYPQTNVAANAAYATMAYEQLSKKDA